VHSVLKAQEFLRQVSLHPRMPTAARLPGGYARIELDT
jgi:hypothetical protein